MSCKTRRTRDRALDATDTCQAALDDTTRILNEMREMLLENNRMLDAIIKHLGVPYRPRADVVKE